MWLPTFVESQLGHRWAVLNLSLQMHPMSLYINIKTLTVEVNDDHGSRMWMFWWEVTSELMALETNLLLETALRTPWWHLSPPPCCHITKTPQELPGEPDKQPKVSARSQNSSNPKLIEHPHDMKEALRGGYFVWNNVLVGKMGQITAIWRCICIFKYQLVVLKYINSCVLCTNNKRD